jgi:RNA polymerase sigma-70 factor (ECF subfamily)
MESHVQPSDGHLVSRMIAREAEALSALYDRYSGTVMAFALKLLRDRAEAEEVTVDVFHQAWRQAPSFDAGRGSVGAWLMTLCRSRAIDKLRSRQRREVLQTKLAEGDGEPAAGGVSAPPRPDHLAEASSRKRRVSEALGALSQVQREAIELAYYEGLSHSEIATRLGEPLGTVKTRIRQGMLTLRDTLAPRL